MTDSRIAGEPKAQPGQTRAGSRAVAEVPVTRGTGVIAPMGPVTGGTAAIGSGGAVAGGLT
ncbi:hypothetical protein GCM10022224_020810 [Nonomuraea antimicrobica]|uniref:Uncharacterized protein n=1 Tax=Nonomuraea antimicrobica TaxID=561173 RepID=A0ABP7BFE4_9ACTN